LSTHTVLHMMPSPIGRMLVHGMQTPFTHVSALWHELAHPPQLLRSLVKSTLAALVPLPHEFWSVGHVHRLL
jgi:hypothetical protein